ncbi:MAG: GIY-YIG nuclease family protein [Patescibacteria group bacterium]
MIYYVYLIQSDKDKSFYTGVTSNLKQRIKEHNHGHAQYSSGKMPFRLKWFAGFLNKKLAYDFEKYLKSHSGIAFRNKRLV